MPSEKNCLFPHHSLSEKKKVIQIFNSLCVSGKLFYLFRLKIKKKQNKQTNNKKGRMKDYIFFDYRQTSLLSNSSESMRILTIQNDI